MVDTDPKKSNTGPREVTWRDAIGMLGLALALPWMLGVPIYIGIYLDRRYGTAPVWFLIWLAAGLISTAFDIYAMVKRFGQFK